MRRMLLIVLVVIVVCASLASAGTGPQNIAVTKHNLSTTGPDLNYAALPGGEDQICIFCHTPHGGSLDAPLWNRDNTQLSGTFDHYDSATLSVYTSGLSTTRAVNKESLICLSCHDGSVGVGDIINPSSKGMPDNELVYIQPDWFGNQPGKQIGTSNAKMIVADLTTYDLTDDHPISLSYASVSTGEKSAEFKSVALVEGAFLTLFDGANKNVECATCHDPHVDYTATGDTDYAPFLAIPNTGSGMCLACHTK